MNLHKTKDFQPLIKLTADYRGIPESAIEIDYFIVYVLQRLSKSDYNEACNPKC